MPAQVRLDAVVERAQVGRLPRKTGAVVDDLERQLALPRVELHVDSPLPAARPQKAIAPFFRAPTRSWASDLALVSTQHRIPPSSFRRGENAVGASARSCADVAPAVKRL